MDPPAADTPLASLIQEIVPMTTINQSRLYQRANVMFGMTDANAPGKVHDSWPKELR